MVGEERESAAAAETGGGGGKKVGGKGGSAEGMRKGPWTPAEDEVLLEHVRRHGEGNWNAVQRLSGLARCGKSCRLRWANHLRPNLKKGSFTPEEEFHILRLHAQLGNKWARMAAQLPGRTDNEIKNYWNTRLKRRQRAGLPIYPPELQDAIRFGRRLQRQNQASQGTPPTLLSAPSYHAHQLPPLQLPPLLDLVSFCPQPEMTPPPTTSLPCQLSFAFPVPSLSPPTTPTSSLLPKPQMGLCNYDLNPPPLMSPPYVVKMELPSNQLYREAAGGGGDGGGPRNCGLTEPLLPEPQPLGLEYIKTGELLSLPAADDQAVRWGNLFCSGDYDCGSSLAGPKETPLQFDFGTKDNGEALGNRMKDMADFLDLPAPVVLNWCNSDNAELPSAQPSAVVSEDVAIDMQQLAPPQDWNVNSWPWSNMPGIC